MKEKPKTTKQKALNAKGSYYSRYVKSLTREIETSLTVSKDKEYFEYNHCLAGIRLTAHMFKKIVQKFQTFLDPYKSYVLNIELGYTLSCRKSDSFRYFYPSHNTVYGPKITITEKSRSAVKKLIEEYDESSLIEKLCQHAPGSNYQFHELTNILFCAQAL